MPYTYSSALITTLKASVDPYLHLLNDTTLRENLRGLLHELIDEIASEFSDVTSEA